LTESLNKLGLLDCPLAYSNLFQVIDFIMLLKICI
jgi:hypothetical protein